MGLLGRSTGSVPDFRRLDRCCSHVGPEVEVSVQTDAAYIMFGRTVYCAYGNFRSRRSRRITHFDKLYVFVRVYSVYVTKYRRTRIVLLSRARSF